MTTSLYVKGKIYWIVGASAGIGAALAKELDARGATLVLSGRSEAGLAEVAATLSQPCRIVPCDVTNIDEVNLAVKSCGKLDGVIYMAGDYSPMSVETWEPSRARAISEVNYIGALQVLGSVVPDFVRQNSGHVVIIGSLAGFCGLPGAISYGASKAAIMHLAQNIRADLKGSRVRVQLVNPGFVDTRLTRKNDFRMPFITTPQKAAVVIARHMERRRFSISFPKMFSLFFKLKGIGFLLRS